MTIEKQWWNILAEIQRDSALRSIYVVGAIDSGKTTFCRFLLNNLVARFRVGWLDCDPGQSIFGPPATVGLAVFDHLGTCDKEFFRFVGATSPAGQFLPTLTGIQKLAEKARTLGLEKIIIDSSGFVLGALAREFQFHVIESLTPNLLVALQRDNEIEMILNNFVRQAPIKTVRLPVSTAVTPRTMTERQQYRIHKFREYFQPGQLFRLKMAGTGIHGMIPNLHDPACFHHRLLALCNSDHWLITAALLEQIDHFKGLLTIFAPPFDPAQVASIQFGAIHLHPDGSQFVPEVVRIKSAANHADNVNEHG